MNYVNFWRRDITLALGATSAALDLPDGIYRLVVSDAAGDVFEVIGATVTAGAATLARGQEGTADADWPAGSKVYCSLTAGTLQELDALTASLQASVAALNASVASLTTSNSDLTGRVTALENPGAFFIDSGVTEISGYSFTMGIGSISPAGTTVYPGGAPDIGGVGEVMELIWSADYPLYGSLQLKVRGTFTDWPNAASLPFTALDIGGLVLTKASLTYVGANAESQVYQWSVAGDPFQVGQNTLKFNA